MLYRSTPYVLFHVRGIIQEVNQGKYGLTINNMLPLEVFDGNRKKCVFAFSTRRNKVSFELVS